MKLFQLLEKNTFMGLLLKSSIFDQFLLSQASIHTAVNFQIDGRLNAGFYSEEEIAQKQMEGMEYIPYRELRPVFLSLIKGKHTPSYFKFVLMLSPSNLENTIRSCGTQLSSSDISAAFLTITYRDNQLSLTSGISYSNFVLDHSFEKEWDKYAMLFLKKHGIIFSEI